MKKTALYVLSCLIATNSYGQGRFSGDFQSNLNFFMKDSLIGASDNPLYDNALSGSDAWLSLRYASNSGYTFFLRADGFANSNLKNPVSTNSDFGIGAWNVTKTIDNKMTLSVGSIYDQIGTGILFRAYEDRGLLIDNAMVGFQMKYKLAKNVRAKGFVGQIKNNNTENNIINNVRYAPIVKGANIEGDFSKGKVRFSPGIGIFNRTLDAASMQAIVSAINAQDISTRFNPKYNMYAFTAYNNLLYKNLSWYAEAAYKTNEAIALTNTSNSAYADRDGSVLYTSLNYGKKGYAISLTGKRTENFVMRTSPSETLLKGMMNWQPIVAVLRPMRLMSRYTPASQDISELAGTANALLSPNENMDITLTYTHINTLNNEKLYREAYLEAIHHSDEKWILGGGVQYLEYNILLYQTRSSSIDVPVLYALTPFVEGTYRINDTKSIRFEGQYMHAEHDYGSWAFALIEYNIAPRWSIAVSDMYNAVPNKGGDNLRYTEPGNHYYNIFAAHNVGSNRFTLAYVKQVDGINCTGGVCRYEPAFSGIKATITSTF